MLRNRASVGDIGHFDNKFDLSSASERFALSDVQTLPISVAKTSVQREYPDYDLFASPMNNFNIIAFVRVDMLRCSASVSNTGQSRRGVLGAVCCDSRSRRNIGSLFRRNFGMCIIIVVLKRYKHSRGARPTLRCIYVALYLTLTTLGLDADESAPHVFFFLEVQHEVVHFPVWPPRQIGQQSAVAGSTHGYRESRVQSATCC